MNREVVPAVEPRLAIFSARAVTLFSKVEEKVRLKDVEIQGKCGIRVETEEMRLKSKGSELDLK